MHHTLWDDFKFKVLHSGNALNRLIAINVAISFIFGLIWVVFALFTLNIHLLDSVKSWLSFPASAVSFLFKPWSLITYQFMHQGFFHLLFNMLVLLMAGRIFREFLGDRKLVVVYLMGGIAGAVLFMAAFTFLPLFASSRQANLIGASASVLAVLAAAGTLVPHYRVSLILLGSVKLMYIVMALVAIDLLSLAGNNAGGHFAHMGGALWGFIYIRALQRGRNTGSWLEQLLEKTSRTKPPKSSVKLRYYNERGRTYTTNKISQNEVDQILDKISRSGYDSLSDHEKEILLRASKEDS